MFTFSPSLRRCSTFELPIRSLAEMLLLRLSRRLPTRFADDFLFMSVYFLASFSSLLSFLGFSGSLGVLLETSSRLDSRLASISSIGGSFDPFILSLLGVRFRTLFCLLLFYWSFSNEDFGLFIMSFFALLFVDGSSRRP